jgi:hypothetical protein
MSAPELARRQAAWDRGQLALAMRASGSTYAAIARHYGVTGERARQIVFKVYCHRKWGRAPPIWRAALSRGDWRQP